MSIIKPPALGRGDTVALVAPAGPVSPEALGRAKKNLEGLGLLVESFGRPTTKLRYLAGPDRERAGALHEAFSRPDVKAVFCLRGGYGASRVVPLLDFGLLRSNPKVFVGSSDITVLLNALVQEAGTVAFHGPSAVEEFYADVASEAVERFWRLLSEPEPLGEVRLQGTSALVDGRARGRLAGGCLSLLAATAGTPWQLDAEGTVLFIEDVGEAPYRIDRMLTQLAQSGVLDGVRGVLLGEMVDCSVPEGEKWGLEEVFLDRLGHLAVPIMAGFPAGHGRNEVVLPMGVEVEMDSGEGRLTVCEAAVT